MNIFKFLISRYKFERAKTRSPAFAQRKLVDDQKIEKLAEPKPKKYPKFGFRM
ncbi:MAG: hypothetical protein COB13_007365 [OCS116 cluster bacterium]|nr:hypothetical protein [OCS116 cluster bacterium]